MFVVSAYEFSKIYLTSLYILKVSLIKPKAKNVYRGTYFIIVKGLISVKQD